MKRQYNLHQKDIKRAIMEYVAKREETPVENLTVELDICEKVEDPRGDNPAHVEATVTGREENP